VFTHRDPEQVVASTLSLFTVAPRKIWRSYDPPKVAPGVLQRLAEGWGQAIRAREAMSAAGKGGQILDCDYRDIVADPIGMVKSINEYFGHTLTPESEQKMVAHLADNPKGKHGPHKYTLEQFGLTAADVQKAFADYSQYFGCGKGLRPCQGSSHGRARELTAMSAGKSAGPAIRSVRPVVAARPAPPRRRRGQPKDQGGPWGSMY
jgi:hypothetical protein